MIPIHRTQPESQPLALIVTEGTSGLAAWKWWRLFLIQAQLDGPILALDPLTPELASRPVPGSFL